MMDGVQNLGSFLIDKLFQTRVTYMKATENENCTISGKKNTEDFLSRLVFDYHISKSDVENQKFPVFVSLPSFYFKRYIL